MSRSRATQQSYPRLWQVLQETRAGRCRPATKAVAPYRVTLLALNSAKSAEVRSFADDLYAKLTEAKIEVLYDDRGLRPGAMFADMELIGIPHRIVVGDRGLDEGRIEYRDRRAEDNEWIALEDTFPTLVSRIRG